jgi:hypothetical protein
MLSIEGVQIGVKNPNSLLEFGSVINNVTKFINEGGKVNRIFYAKHLQSNEGAVIVGKYLFHV